MKKVLVLSFSVLFVLASCGGSSATKGQSTGAASAVTPILAGAVSGTGGAIKSVTIDQAVPIDSPIDFSFTCPTSGTAATTGTVTGSFDNASGAFNFNLNATTAFKDCSGTDKRCTPPLSYILNGSVTTTSASSGTASTTGLPANFTFTVTQSGSINVTGFATFTCDINTTMTLTGADVAGLESESVDGVLGKMTGTICGQDVSTIKAIIESDDATYCKTVEDIATQNS